MSATDTGVGTHPRPSKRHPPYIHDRMERRTPVTVSLARQCLGYACAHESAWHVVLVVVAYSIQMEEQTQSNIDNQLLDTSHAFTAYFRSGKWMSFLRCLSVFSDASCWYQCSLSTTTAFDIADAPNLGQTSPDGTGLLGSEVKGQILLALVELAKVLPLLLVHDGQDTSDRLADGVATRAA